MRDLDLQSATYRIWRLKRLITVAVLLPFPGIFLATLIGLGLGFGNGGGAVWFLWILSVLALAVRFPNGWLAHFALGLPLAAITFLSPFAIILGVGPFIGSLLAIAILAAGFLWINMNLPMILEEKSLGNVQNTFETKARLPGETLRDAVFLRPDATSELHECGPANADGVFKIKALGYTFGDLMGEEGSGVIEFYGRVTESDEFTQTTQYFIDDKGTAASTILEEIIPLRHGCRYIKEEMHDHFSVYSALGFWLNDVEADHFTATLDHIKGRRPRAIKLAPYDTFLTWLTAQISKRRQPRREGEP